jgi:hypothetical protein
LACAKNSLRLRRDVLLALLSGTNYEMKGMRLAEFHHKCGEYGTRKVTAAKAKLDKWNGQLKTLLKTKDIAGEVDEAPEKIRDVIISSLHLPPVLEKNYPVIAKTSIKAFSRSLTTR